MSDVTKDNQIYRLTLSQSKTAAELLVELNLSTDHIVLVEGKRVSADFLIQERDTVVILPLIAGG